MNKNEILILNYFKNYKLLWYSLPVYSYKYTNYNYSEESILEYLKEHRQYIVLEFIFSSCNFSTLFIIKLLNLLEINHKNELIKFIESNPFASKMLINKIKLIDLLE